MHTNTTAARVFGDREEKDVLWKCAQSLEREERVCSFISPDLCAFPSLPPSSRPLLFWLAALILFSPHRLLFRLFSLAHLFFCLCLLLTQRHIVTHQSEAGRNSEPGHQ